MLNGMGAPKGLGELPAKTVSRNWKPKKRIGGARWKLLPSILRIQWVLNRFMTTSKGRIVNKPEIWVTPYVGGIEKGICQDSCLGKQIGDPPSRKPNPTGNTPRRAGMEKTVVVKKPKCRLTGKDGNAFMILGLVQRALKEAGQPENAEKFIEEATRGDYNNIFRVAAKYVLIS